jgi:Ca2+ transporting ATPase
MQRDDKNNKIEEEGKIINHHFGITKERINDLFTSYEQRTKDEELNFISEHGGEEEFFNKLQTSHINGIRDDPEEKLKRLAEFDTNAPDEDEVPCFCYFVWDALGDLMIRILICAAIIQIALGACPPPITEEGSNEWVEGLSICFAVIVVILVGSVTNYSKEVKFKQLNDTNTGMTKFVVTRGGKTHEMLAAEILVGDLINMATGKILPADGIIVYGNEVKIDESPLTGESDLIQKETYTRCLQVKESMLEKGHKIDNKHSLPSPLVFSGTLMKQGEGKYIVLAVGRNSAKGKIEESVKQSQEAEDSKTPLEEKLDTIAAQIGKFGMAASITTLVALMIRFGIDFPQREKKYLEDYNYQQDVKKQVALDSSLLFNQTINDTISTELISPQQDVASKILHIVMLCIAIIVVAIPEGLPLAVTLSLAFSIKKMMDENNLVRKMHACETMGGANFICTDKTGTLTKNLMSVNSFFNGQESLLLEEDTKDVNNRISADKYFLNKDYYKLLKTALCLNVEAEVNEQEEVKESSKTDQGFIDMLHIFGESIYQVRKNYYPKSISDLKKFPFNSDRKRMTTLIQHEEFPTGYRLYLKGASEIILKWVTNIIDPRTNQMRPMSDVEHTLCEGVIHKFAIGSLRTICVAYKDITQQEYENYQEKDSRGDYLIEKSNLILIGIAGIRDTLRAGVKESVQKCNNAGITVIMVTGDNKETAIAIAKDCSIIKNDTMLKQDSLEGNYIAMVGEDFYNAIGGLECEVCFEETSKCKCPTTKSLAKQRGIDEDRIKREKVKNMEKFVEITKDLRVLARSRPLDKYALVFGLRHLKNVVAVTGDGTNDAPALSRADVGFSMGQGGTDIAKNASDIIILDDNFSSIVVAVLWGRNIYDNIRKFIQFQLTVNICACFLVFITACIGNETPLTTIQMLWVNMIMDSLGSLALATEPPHENLLNRMPYKRKESIISNKMWKHILCQGFFELGLLLFLYIYGPYFIKEDEPYRLAESRVIERCYGLIPGGGKAADGSFYIIHGSSSYWPETTSRIPEANLFHCGGYFRRGNLKTAFKLYEHTYHSTSHMTIVFNTFVFYTLFNQVNARVIDDGLNILYRIHKNLLFIAICAIEMGLQALLVQFGSPAFQTSFHGLTGSQWGICLGFGATTFIVNFIVKFIPMEPCIERMFQILTCQKSKSNQIADINDLDVNNVSSNNLKPDEKGKLQLNNPVESQARQERDNELRGKQDSKSKNIIELVRKPSKMLTSKNPSIQNMKRNKDN